MLLLIDLAVWRCPLPLSRSTSFLCQSSHKVDPHKNVRTPPHLSEPRFMIVSLVLIDSGLFQERHYPLCPSRRWSSCSDAPNTSGNHVADKLTWCSNTESVIQQSTASSVSVFTWGNWKGRQEKNKLRTSLYRWAVDVPAAHLRHSHQQIWGRAAFNHAARPPPRLQPAQHPNSQANGQFLSESERFINPFREILYAVHLLSYCTLPCSYGRMFCSFITVNIKKILLLMPVKCYFVLIIQCNIFIALQFLCWYNF